MTINNSSNLPTQSLDVDELVNNFQDYLKSQDTFKDYNFEGAAFSVLIRTLANDTYLNGVMANIVVSETHLDSSQKRESVVSQAKTLSYVPTSTKAAKMFVDLTITEQSTSMPSSVILEKGSVFNTRDEKGLNVRFVTTKAYSANKSAGNFFFQNVEIVQGSYNIIDFLKNDEELNQRFILPSNSIDTEYLEVFVQEGIDNTVFTKYNLSSNILNNTSSSEIYYLQEAEGGKFELYFGDGVLGKAVGHKKLIRVIYLSTIGSAGNDYAQVSFDQTPNPNPINDGASSVTTRLKSTGGLDAETIESIKFRAPKSYISQNRSVTTTDYENVIMKNFPDVKSVSVWGGEDGYKGYAHFGKVFVAINPYDGAFFTSNYKQSIYERLKKDYAVSGTIPVIVDPDYIYLNITSTIYVIQSASFINSAALIGSVRDAIREYSNGYLERFNADFEKSKFTKMIDAVSNLISSNDTNVSLEYRFYPIVNVRQTEKIYLGNKIIPGSLSSSLITHENISGYFKDDGLGNINHYDQAGVKVKKVGTVFYENGTILLENILINAAPANVYMQFFARTSLANVFANKEQIIKINDINLVLENIT